MNICTPEVLIADYSESLIYIGSLRGLIKQIFALFRLIDVLLDILAFTSICAIYVHNNVEKTSTTVI